MSTYLEAPASTIEQPAVADQLDTLLGEHLMPLRLRSAPGADEPYLLAVDASGQPVVVEVVGVLDADTVVHALRHAGRAARMSTRDLAQAYRGGADRFASHLAAFRLTVPTTSLLSTFVRGGARLLLVCSHVPPGMDDVIEFLLQPGWHVDVLKVRVQDVDGQRVVDVSPIATAPPPHRTTEPWIARPGGQSRATEQTDRSGLYGPGNGVSETYAPDRYVSEDHYADRYVPPPSAAPNPPVRTPDFAVAMTSVAPGPFPDPRPVAPPRNGMDVPWRERPEPWRTGSRPVDRPSPRQFAPRPDPRLAVVADELGAPIALVWGRERSGEVHEALLRADGTLELTDGSRYADPDAAARAVSGSHWPVDGWRAWRIGSLRGPSLADLVPGVAQYR